MKLFHPCVLYLAMLLSQSLAYFYPPVYWHKDGCGFSQSITNSNATQEFYMQVIPNSAVNIVCPNYVTVNTWFKDAGLSVSNPTLNENMWLVDKQGYDNCRVNEKGDPKFNRLFMLCNIPQTIKYESFYFSPNFNEKEPKFDVGQHYYFISTSRGYISELSTRKISGSHGSCKRYHMKLHIYVCDPKKEDCIWEMPRCDAPADLRRDMHLIDGKLPRRKAVKPTSSVKTTKAELVATTRLIQITIKNLNNHQTDPRKPTATTSPFSRVSGLEHRQKICPKTDKGMSIQLILNFVLGSVALFMAMVIIILVCGLSSKSKNYKSDRPVSHLSSTHDPANQYGNYYTYGETVRYSDVHGKVTILTRTPPTSPSVIVRPIVHALSPMQACTPPETPHSSNASKQFDYPSLNPRRTTDGASMSSEASMLKSDGDEKSEPEAV